MQQINFISSFHKVGLRTNPWPETEHDLQNLFLNLSTGQSMMWAIDNDFFVEECDRGVPELWNRKDVLLRLRARLQLLLIMMSMHAWFGRSNGVKMKDSCESKLHTEGTYA